MTGRPHLPARRTRHRGRRGVALMLVLWLIVVLATIGAGSLRDTRAIAGVAGEERAHAIARYAAASGIEALAAEIEDSLRAIRPGRSRRAWLNTFALTGGRKDTMMLGDGRFAVTVSDVAARLDVNAASELSLRSFLSHFTDLASAEHLARRIRSWLDEGSGRRLERVDELRERGLLPAPLLARAAPHLTVHGDGAINSETAPHFVLAAALGKLRPEPVRLVIESRGWQARHTATYHVRAVFAITGERLELVHTEERGG